MADHYNPNPYDPSGHPQHRQSRYAQRGRPPHYITAVQGHWQDPNMSQYNFLPPPPPPGPPPPSNYPQQNPQYGGYQQQQQPPPRGGGPPQGGARGGYMGGFNGPPQQQHAGPQAFQQGPPQPAGGAYNPQNPYLGPQVSGPSPQGPPQWQNDQRNQQHGPPQHSIQHHGLPQTSPQQPPHVQQPPQPAPLQPQNYHPNYAPQAYQPQQQQQPQYGPQQPPQFQQSPPVPYGPPQGGPPQWQGPPQQAQFTNRGRGGGGIGRGGFTGARGGHNAPLMGPPIRMGFDNGGQAQAGNGFPTPYPVQTPPTPFSQPYQPYTSQGFSADRPPLDQNPYNSQRGRGNLNFRGRGRGDFQFRGNRQNGGTSRASSDSFQRSPAGAENGGKKNKKKRRTNTLGLTPNGADHESEDEIDDIDEEARLVTLLGPDVPQEPTDLAEWLTERKSRYPTKARREAAKEEHRKRSERRADKAKKPKDMSVKHENGESKAPESKLEKEQRKAAKLRSELEKAERKIQNAMQGSKRKRENGDEGDDQVSEEDSGESSESGDSDNEQPEAMSTRSSGPQRVSQPAKAQLQRHCKYFSTGGTCGKKGKCRFVHDQDVRNQALSDKEANGGKMTLAQRLILNDTAKDDLTILKSIKYLKEKGLMKDQGSANTSANDEDENSYSNMDYGDAS